MEERKLTIIRPMVQISPKVTYDYNHYFESRKLGEEYDAATQTSLFDWEFMKDEILKCSHPPLVQTVVFPNKKVTDTATTVKSDSCSNQDKDKVADNCSQTSEGSSVGEEKDGITSSSSKSKVDKIKEDFPPFKRWAKKVASDTKYPPMHFVTPSYGESQPMFPFPTMAPKTEKVTIAESYGKMFGQERQSTTSVTQDNVPSKYNSKKEDTNNVTPTYQTSSLSKYSFQVKENQLDKFGQQRKVHYSIPITTIESKGCSNPFIKTMTNSMTSKNQFSSDESEDESTGIGKSNYTRYLEYCRSQKLEPHSKSQPHSKTESDEESTGKSYYSRYLEYCRSLKMEPHSHTRKNVTATKNERKVVNPFKKTTSNDDIDSENKLASDNDRTYEETRSPKYTNDCSSLTKTEETLQTDGRPG